MCGFSPRRSSGWRSEIIAGHGRHLAARLPGLREVPVIRLAHLSPLPAAEYATSGARGNGRGKAIAAAG
ncbi:MAG: hypothetical protein IPK66_08160 [Rhodospirillales bacterium]|nr:hypothetical protein [Rhodospirillales bacterium]